MERILTKEEFESFGQKNDGNLRCIKFSASWCGPCRLLAQVISEIEPIENVIFAEVDLDEAEEEIATENNVRNIPTVLFYKNGLLVDRFTGMIGKDAILTKIKENLEK